MNTKLCTKCNKEKTLDCFAKNPQKKDGLNYKCKECQRIYFKQHYQKNKQYYVDKAKENSLKYRKEIADIKKERKKNGCIMCGENHPATLDFHHVDAKMKEFNVGRDGSRYGVQTVKNELDKCVVMCSNCHRKLHWEEGSDVT